MNVIVFYFMADGCVKAMEAENRCASFQIECRA